MKKIKKLLQNNEICSCGNHHGVGDWGPEKRAGVYAWYRDKRPFHFTKEMWMWLADYQRIHGHVEPNI